MVGIRETSRQIEVDRQKTSVGAGFIEIIGFTNRKQKGEVKNYSRFLDSRT